MEIVERPARSRTLTEKAANAVSRIFTNSEYRGTAEQRTALLEGIYSNYVELHAQTAELHDKKKHIDYDIFQSNRKEINDLLFGSIESHQLELGDWDTWERVESVVKKYAYARPKYRAEQRDELHAITERASALSRTVIAQRQRAAQLETKNSGMQTEVNGLLTLLRMRDQQIQSLTNKNNTYMLHIRHLERECVALREQSTNEDDQLFTDLKLIIQANKELEKQNAELRAKLHVRFGVLDVQPNRKEHASLQITIPPSDAKSDESAAMHAELKDAASREEYIIHEIPLSSMIIEMKKSNQLWSRRLEREVDNALTKLDIDASLTYMAMGGGAMGSFQYPFLAFDNGVFTMYEGYEVQDAVRLPLDEVPVAMAPDAVSPHGTSNSLTTAANREPIDEEDHPRRTVNPNRDAKCQSTEEKVGYDASSGITAEGGTPEEASTNVVTSGGERVDGEAPYPEQVRSKRGAAQKSQPRPRRLRGKGNEEDSSEVTGGNAVMDGVPLSNSLNTPKGWFSLRNSILGIAELSRSECLKRECLHVNRLRQKMSNLHRLLGAQSKALREESSALTTHTPDQQHFIAQTLQNCPPTAADGLLRYDGGVHVAEESEGGDAQNARPPSFSSTLMLSRDVSSPFRRGTQVLHVTSTASPDGSVLLIQGGGEGNGSSSPGEANVITQSVGSNEASAVGSAYGKPSSLSISGAPSTQAYSHSAVVEHNLGSQNSFSKNGMMGQTLTALRAGGPSGTSDGLGETHSFSRMELKSRDLPWSASIVNTSDSHTGGPDGFEGIIAALRREKNCLSGMVGQLKQEIGEFIEYTHALFMTLLQSAPSLEAAHTSMPTAAAVTSWSRGGTLAAGEGGTMPVEAHLRVIEKAASTATSNRVLDILKEKYGINLEERPETSDMSNVDWVVQRLRRAVLELAAVNVSSEVGAQMRSHPDLSTSGNETSTPGPLKVHRERAALALRSVPLKPYNSSRQVQERKARGQSSRFPQLTAKGAKSRRDGPVPLNDLTESPLQASLSAIPVNSLRTGDGTASSQIRHYAEVPQRELSFTNEASLLSSLDRSNPTEPNTFPPRDRESLQVVNQDVLGDEEVVAEGRCSGASDVTTSRPHNLGGANDIGIDPATDPHGDSQWDEEMGIQGSNQGAVESGNAGRRANPGDMWWRREGLGDNSGALNAKFVLRGQQLGVLPPTQRRCSTRTQWYYIDRANNFSLLKDPNEKRQLREIINPIIRQQGRDILEILRDLQPRWTCSIQAIRPTVYRYDMVTEMDVMQKRAEDFLAATVRHIFGDKFDSFIKRTVLPIASVAGNIASGAHQLSSQLLNAIRQLREIEECHRKERIRLLFRRSAANIRSRRLLRNHVYQGNAFIAYVTVLYDRWRNNLDKKLDDNKEDIASVLRVLGLQQTTSHRRLPVSAASASILPPIPLKTSRTFLRGKAIGKSSNHFENVDLPNDQQKD